MMATRRGGAPRIAMLVSVALLVVGCRDYEQRARAVGAAARDDIEARCVDEAASKDTGVEGIEVCGDERCRAACSGADVAKGFATTCVNECRSTAICATDADCAAGLRCVAIAPRVRRCLSPM